MHTARTDDDKSLTFQTKTDARTWLAGVHMKIALGEWEPPSVIASRRQAAAAEEKARGIGFTEYAERWVKMIRSRPNRSGRMRAVGTVRSYKSKVAGYLVPEFGDTPIREIDADRIREMTDRLDKIPSPLNPKSKFNGITRPVLIVLMMILRQAARDGIVPAAPNVSIPGQKAVRRAEGQDGAKMWRALNRSKRCTRRRHNAGRSWCCSLRGVSSAAASAWVCNGVISNGTRMGAPLCTCVGSSTRTLVTTRISRATLAGGL
jgi:hypothetical protein